MIIIISLLFLVISPICRIGDRGELLMVAVIND